MILTNIAIKEAIDAEHLIIKPFDEKNLQGASFDITLSDSFSMIKKSDTKDRTPISLSEPLPEKKITTKEFILHPKRFVLASTVEYIHVPIDIGVYVQGRSSIGRTGLFIQNAGWIDPGFRGQITLEMYNAGSYPIVLPAGIRIGQLIFQRLDGFTDKPYNGKYQGQKGATGSLIFKDPEFEV